MYVPRHFEQADRAAIKSLIAAYPLATLVTQQGGQMVADHVPMFWHEAADGRETLLGHVAKANSLWQLATTDADAPLPRVLCVFQGPQSYVSPNWYATKATDPRVVPTWNYMVVHVSGALRAIQEPARLRQIVGTLTRTHEASQTHPWQVEDAPEEYTQALLGAIVGIAVDVHAVIGKWKISQNRKPADRTRVAEALREQGHASDIAMATAIERL